MKDEQVRRCERCNSEMYHDISGWYCSNPACGNQIEMKPYEGALQMYESEIPITPVDALRLAQAMLAAVNGDWSMLEAEARRLNLTSNSSQYTLFDRDTGTRYIRFPNGRWQMFVGQQ
ncbi:MAG: hypothetical protein ACXWQR_18460 [Ktedonobacterales bacterium]